MHREHIQVINKVRTKQRPPTYPHIYISFLNNVRELCIDTLRLVFVSWDSTWSHYKDAMIHTKRIFMTLSDADHGSLHRHSTRKHERQETAAFEWTHHSKRIMKARAPTPPIPAWSKCFAQGKSTHRVLKKPLHECLSAHIDLDCSCRYLLPIPTL